MRIACIMQLLRVWTDASPDQWQILNQGALSLVIAANNKALYAITSSRLMQVIYDDTGFSTTDGYSMLDLAVNEDYDIWITNTGYNIFYRTGVSSSNLKGTGWLLKDGLLLGIATGRYGLVFGHNHYRNMFTRLGIGPSYHQGTAWLHIYGSGIKDEACTRRACMVVTTNGEIFTTGLMQNIDSPTMSNNWIKFGNNVVGVAAYSNNKVWKIDLNHVVWEAVNVLDENLIHLNWVRRSYEEQRFKDISITDKYAFAIHDDGNIYVQTGCPIFDFEDNDISYWVQTGTAFQTQPVLSQNTITGKPGKFGERCIDTLSKRKTSDMPDEDSSFQGDGVTGTLLSPLFQIRTDVLHFAIGGGSHPNNYVGLIVDNSEVRQSSGKSLQRTVSGVKVRMSRFWWDVSAYKQKCGQIKIHDSYTGVWGHTLFDDLRASPPCSKRMNVLLTANHKGDVSVGQRIVYDIKLEGFYTSSLRPLKIKASFPVKNNNPFIFIESINVTSTYCKTTIDFESQSEESNANGKTYSISATLTTLLSDATVQIVARAYDHNDLKVGSPETTSMKLSVDFAGDYSKVFKRDITTRRFGNETAKLMLKEEIINFRDYYVGDNITVKVDFSHNYTESLVRAYKVTIRLLVPGYVKILDVSGLNNALGDVADIKETMATVRIPEIEFLETRSISLKMRLVGDDKWMAKPGRNYSGQILVDAIYYCHREDCKDSRGNESQVVTLLKGKFYNFQFQYKKPQLIDPKSCFSRIIGGNGSIVFICGPEGQHSKTHCFYSNATTSTWHGLTPALQNVTYYDAAKNELYGLTNRRRNIKLYGEHFDKNHALDQAQWSDVIAASGAFIKPENMAVSQASQIELANMKYHGYCCP